MFIRSSEDCCQVWDIKYLHRFILAHVADLVDRSLFIYKH